MANKFAAGKFAIAECDRCGQRFKLKQLKKEIVKTRIVEIKVCPACWEPDQPQLSVGLYPVFDPQALREPRPDVSYQVSGTSGLQVSKSNTTALNSNGFPQNGSRIFEWGWSPIGGARGTDTGLTPNNLILSITLGSVTISTS
jgi:hypothetical protein